MTATDLGLLAGAITTIAGVPQVARAWRTKSVEDISIWQPGLLCIGMTLWLVYGVMIGDLPLMVANSFSLLCYAVLLALKILYRDRDKEDGSDYS
jgi:MtN3 and saliva related transmembrane protein